MRSAWSVDGETLDRAVRGLGVAGAAELIDRAADHDDARPRARRRAGWQVGPLLGPRIPDLRAAQRRELVVTRWQATDHDDASVGQRRGASGLTRIAERSGADEDAELEIEALARARRRAVAADEEDVAAAELHRGMLHAWQVHVRTLGPFVGRWVVDEGGVGRGAAGVEAAGDEHATVRKRERAELRSRERQRRGAEPAVVLQVVDLGRLQEPRPLIATDDHQHPGEQRRPR